MNDGQLRPKLRMGHKAPISLGGLTAVAFMTFTPYRTPVSALNDPAKRPCWWRNFEVFNQLALLTQGITKRLAHLALR